MQNLQISYPVYFLILIAIVAGVYALSLYFRDRRIKENKSWLPYLLGLLRFSAIMGILFLLLTPLFKRYVSETQKPLLVFLNDQSASIQEGSSPEQLSALSEAKQTVKTDLSDSYDIVSLPFGENLGTEDSDSINNQSTNISCLLYTSPSPRDS